ncbi:hypothetical protein GCM10011297_31750 [Bacterioplanes sanyensis]|nr:hypothetical protein GCM10011297_31750 [Bacterioplanes sanyensis]
MLALLVGCGGQGNDYPDDVDDDNETPTEPDQPTEPDEPDEPAEPDPQEPVTELNCPINDVPHFGVVKNLYSTPSWQTLYAADGSDDFDFNLELGANQYGIFMYPAALGDASFSSGASHGWQGATWGNGDIPSTGTGPVLVMVDGVPWLVYRTDFPSLGEASFSVEFANSGEVGDTNLCSIFDYAKAADHGLAWLADVTSLDETPTPGEPTTPEPEPEPEPSTEDCRVLDQPHYGTVSNLFTAPELSQLYEASNAADFAFTLDIASDDFGILAYPAALGAAAVRQGTAITGPEANWNGARWGQGDTGGDSGPVVMRINGDPWLIYRTEASGGGAQTFNVDFTRNASINEVISCDVSTYPAAADHNLGWATVITTADETTPPDPATGSCRVTDVPRYGVASANLNHSSDIAALANTFTSTTDERFQVTLAADEYAFLAYPAALGEVRMTNEGTGLVRAWAAATWNIADTVGTQFTPVVIEHQGQPWFVYRHDAPGVATLDYTASFDRDLALNAVADCSGIDAYPGESSGTFSSSNTVIGLELYATGTVDTALESGVVSGNEWRLNPTDQPDGNYDLYFVLGDNGSQKLLAGPIVVTVTSGTLPATAHDVDLAPWVLQ